MTAPAYRPPGARGGIRKGGRRGGGVGDSRGGAGAEAIGGARRERNDKSWGKTPDRTGGEGGLLKYSGELIALAREVGDFSVGVAAFPEVHPRSPDRATDRRHLAAKLEAADFGITQFFWDSSHYFRMVEELDALGVHTPVIAGVMPIRNVDAQLGRMSAMNGTDVPQWLRDRLEPVKDIPAEVRKIGVEVASKIAQELLDGGVTGLHLYTLNFSRSVREIYANLGLLPEGS